MELCLSVVSHQKASLGHEAVRVFRLRGGTIGRSRDNDWILPDAERVVSGHHARLSYERGGYYLEDTSSNGTVINEHEILTRGQKRLLRHGDILLIGDYEIHVTLRELSSDWATSSNERCAGDTNFAARQCADHQAPSIAEATSELRAEDRLKELAAFAASAPALSRGEPPPLTTGASHPDHAPADHQHFVPPRPVTPIIPEELPPPVAEVLPDDWWRDDETDPFSPPTPPPVATAEPPRPPLTADLHAAAPAEHGVTHPGSARGSVPAPARAVVAEVKPADASLLDTLVNGTPLHDVDQAAAHPSAEVVAPIPAAQAAQSNKQPPVTVAPPSADDDGARLMAAFFAGLGLKEVPAAVATEEWFRRLGALVRIVTQGTLDIARARALLKGEFRLTQTIVRPSHNNPLKFAVNTEHALDMLFGKRLPGFMNAEEAFHDVFHDLKRHEFAVIAGMRAAFDHLLQDFAPEAIETAARAHGRRLNLPFTSRYWEFYQTYYRELVARATDDFQGVFGAAFVRAYEEQFKAPAGED